MAEPWQSDWVTFVSLLQQKLHAGQSTAEPSQYFGGKLVTWTGTVDQVPSKDDLGVGVSLPERELDLGDGCLDVLDGLALPIAKATLAVWQKVVVGSSVMFSATFLPADAVFPAVGISKLSSGKKLLFLRLGDANLISV